MTSSVSEDGVEDVVDSVFATGVPMRAWWVPYACGGVGGMAAQAVVHPAEVVKVRVQLQGAGLRGRAHPIAAMRAVIASDGVAGLWRGLSCGLLRQATYTTTRMGLFDFLLRRTETRNRCAAPPNSDPTPSLIQRAACSLIAGAVGAVVGTPPDVAAVRMQADMLLPRASRTGPRNVVHALVSISRTEGIPALWRGTVPAVARAMALNVGMLTTYSHVRAALDPQVHGHVVRELAAASLSGLIAAALSLPFDFIKTRLQRQLSTTTSLPTTNVGAGAATVTTTATAPRYTGFFNCAITVFRTEGLTAFFRGFPVYYMRVAPHAMLTLIISSSLSALLTGTS